jgi:hypothetical protein
MRRLDITPEERKARKYAAQEKWRKAHPESVERSRQKRLARDPDYERRRRAARTPEQVARDNAATRRWQMANSDKRKAVRFTFRQTYPERHLLTSVKCAAKAQAIPFNITADDLPVPTHCPVLHIPLVVTQDKRTDNTPSVDRIIPSKGYVRGNVRVISWRANRQKNDADHNERILHGEDAKRLLALELPPDSTA